MRADVDLSKIKKAVLKAGAELQGAARDAEWQSQLGEETEHPQLKALTTRLQAAQNLVGELTRDIVKLERNPPPVKPEKRHRKSNRWQVTS